MDPHAPHTSMLDRASFDALGKAYPSAEEIEVSAWPKDPRSGRQLMTPKVVDYDISQAPPVVQMLVAGVRAMDPEEVKAEAVNQWPRLFPVPVPEGFTPERGGGFFLPEDIKRARDKLVGFVVGVALGVTKLEADGVTDVVKAAANLDGDIRRRQEAERKAKHKAAADKAKRVEENRRAAKAQRKARKSNR